jgi:hypothetical protein
MKVLVVGCGLPDLVVGHRLIEFLLSGGDHLLELGYLGVGDAHGLLCTSHGEGQVKSDV